MFNTDPVEVTARKAHACTWCCEEIPAGSKYLRWVSIDDGSAGTNKMHPECHESAAADGVPYEYSPGEGQGNRPAPGEFGRRSGKTDRTCERGGSCPWCRSGRKHAQKRQTPIRDTK